jgi:molecular chaperone DnaK
MPSSRAVGIDLGATRAAVALIDERGRSAMFRDSQGDLLTPSVVYFEDDEWLHGRAAKLAAATQPARAGEFYKRDLGERAYARAIGGELVPPEVVEGCLVRKLLDNLASEGVAPTAIALSHPAGFTQAQRRARVDAARMAGADVLGTLHDPMAAALSYAETQGYLVPNCNKPGQRVLVFDLGGSKLDVAIIEIKPNRLRTMAIGGNTRLGGRDWDQRLAEYLAEQFAKQFGDDPRHDMISVRRLLESAEEAKQSLTARQQTRVQVQRSDDAAAIIVTRQAFEDQTADLVDAAMQVAEQTLAQAGIVWRDMGGLLIVGGATRMPAIAARLKTLSGFDPATGVHPDEAVARGAAIFAEHLLAKRDGRRSPLEFSLVDITVHNLGLEWRDEQSGRIENVVLIARGSELPCGTVSKVVTDREDQDAIELVLLEGESRQAEQCTRIARLAIRDLPTGLPKGAQINVQYQLTAEGRLQAKPQLARTGAPLTVNVRRENAPTENELTDWKQWLAKRAGLKSLHELLARHAKENLAREEAEAAAAPSLPPPVRPPALPGRGAAAAGETSPEFTVTGGENLHARRMSRRRMTPRKLAILVGGYIVSAIVGTAIGYYILMRIDPSYNWWNLRLPGLQAPQSHLDNAPVRTALLDLPSQEL